MTERPWYWESDRSVITEHIAARDTGSFGLPYLMEPTELEELYEELLENLDGFHGVCHRLRIWEDLRTGLAARVAVEFFMDGKEVASANRAMEEKAGLLAARATRQAQDESGKLALLAGWMIDNVEFGPWPASFDDMAAVSSAMSAKGALLDGMAVCEGYARAFALLCRKAGIGCRVVRGRLLDGEGAVAVDAGAGLREMGHAWNMVVVDGREFHIDVVRSQQRARRCCDGGLSFPLLMDDMLLRESGYWSAPGQRLPRSRFDDGSRRHAHASVGADGLMAMAAMSDEGV